MGLESIIGEAGKSFLTAERTSKLGAEFFKKDAELLEKLGEIKTTELTEAITTHLKTDGRPGSAEYMGFFAKSAILDKELSLSEQGILDLKKIDEGRLPLVLDTQLTTTEMIKSGQAILTPEASADFLGTANTLRYKLEQHIGKTAQKASQYYATELTREKSVKERLQEVFGVKQEPYNIPFIPDDTEMAKILELSGARYTTRDEATQTFQRELLHMMKQRPEVIGLKGTASFSIFVGEISQVLSENTASPINIKRIRMAHTLMKGRGAMEELQIYPEFGNAIEKGVERDLS